MLSLVGLLPGIIAVIYLIYQFSSGSSCSTSKAFIKVYLPCLFLFHMGFYVNITFIPAFTFGQSALIPIFFAYFVLPSTPVMRTKRGLRVLDILVIGYAVSCVVSEYVNTGMLDGPDGSLWKSLLFREVFNVMVPYYLARKLIYPYGLTPAFMKMLIVCCLITLCISAYEWRFVVNLHVELFRKFFNYMQSEWVPIYRYGLVRVSGPYGHPILFGIILAFCFLCNHWLIRNKFWKRNFLFLDMRAKTKGYLIGLFLFAGLILVFSRGPLLSMLISFLIIGIGYSKRKHVSLLGRSAILVVIGYICYDIVDYYSNITPERAIDTLDSTGAYRAKLVQSYMKYIDENFWLGWGYTTWPKASGMLSIDNEYLWLAIIHGMIPVFFFVAMIVFSVFKLFFRGMKLSYNDKEDRSLAFTLFSIICMLAVSLVTVYMGQQVENLFFMTIGLTQGFLDTFPRKNTSLSSVTPPVNRNAYAS